MKRISILVVVLITSSIFSFAQWNPNGTHIYNSNTGYVGIGTGATVPQINFEVVGLGQIIRNPDAAGYTRLRLYNNANNLFRALSLDYSGSGYVGSLITGGLQGESASISTTGAFPLSLGTSNTARMTIASGGNVGIGTSAPAFTLDISTSGDYKGVQLSHNSGRWTRLYSSLPPWSFNGITGANDAGIIFGNLGGTVDNGFVIAPHQNSTSGLRIDKNGNVGIGTSNPTQKLTVNGTIYSKEVKVDLSVPGPDYVFEETYNLPSLTETETYIKQNKHLPEVPSACEMEEKGINLSEMNMILLKKVEELTLYVIELKKENEKQNELIKTLFTK